jgi:hypothetical protein
MAFRNRNAIREFGKRCSARGAARGRELETEIETLLARMCEDGLITSFERHRPNSVEDSHGKDFTISKETPEGTKSASFGITISAKSRAEARMRHRSVPQMHFPPEIKPETIRKKILALLA